MFQEMFVYSSYSGNRFYCLTGCTFVWQTTQATQGAVGIVMYV